MDKFIFILFNFVLYSIIGWGIEALYSYVITGNLKKDGFLKGPYKPMYGVAFTLIIISEIYFDFNIYTMILIYLLIPTITEFISGYLLRRTLNKEYWDYSNLKFNYKGLISMRFSLYWMILSYIGIRLVYPISKGIFITYSSILTIIIPMIVIVMILELIITVKSIMLVKRFA